MDISWSMDTCIMVIFFIYHFGKLCELQSPLLYKNYNISNTSYFTTMLQNAGLHFQKACAHSHISSIQCVYQIWWSSIHFVKFFCCLLMCFPETVSKLKLKFNLLINSENSFNIWLFEQILERVCRLPAILVSLDVTAI